MKNVAASSADAMKTGPRMDSKGDQEMHHRSWLAGASMTVLALFAASCTAVVGIDKDYHLLGDGGSGGATTTATTGGGGSTGTQACTTPADCLVEEPECRIVASCDDGQCVFDDAADGKPLSSQNAGDCSVIVCDGNGATRIEAQASDVEDDGKVCTLDACDGTTPTHVPQASAPCYTGLPSTLGVGICQAGTTMCNADGTPGACVGETLPAVEDCDDASLDEDCNGLANESGPSCFCGDGFVSNGEQCDEGGATATCNASCTGPSCGDGVIDSLTGEVCDDGNDSDADACSSTCQPQEVLSVVAGSAHSCALLALGTGKGGVVKCWGDNAGGQLGLGDNQTRGDEPGEMGAALPFVNLGLGATATQLVAGQAHTCALLMGGSVKCWGVNGQGQLGLGDTESRGDQPGEMGNALPVVDLGAGLTALQLAAGALHTCALLSNNTVKCWGSNFNGELGLGDVNHRGDQPGEMGDALPAVDLGSTVSAGAITAGHGATCARLVMGGLKCWGRNDSGQLGQGDIMDRGDGPTEMGKELPVIELGNGLTVTKVVAGAFHLCASLSNGTLKCWGNNSGGQLDTGDKQHRGDQPGEMGDALPAVNLGGASALAIAAGEAHSCVVRSDAQVACWGVETSGETGGSQPVDLGAGGIVTHVTAGASHGCAIKGVRLKCWGYNGAGQLGLGDALNRGLKQSEMGDALPFVRLWNDQW